MLSKAISIALIPSGSLQQTAIVSKRLLILDKSCKSDLSKVYDTSSDKAAIKQDITGFWTYGTYSCNLPKCVLRNLLRQLQLSFNFPVRTKTPALRSK